MFDKAIIRTDNFLDMPQSAQNLYFHLGMESDDEGFVQPKMVMRTLGSSDDDLRILTVRNFVIPFESGVVVITNWKENNYLNENRIKPTKHINERSLLSLTPNGSYVFNKNLQMLNQSSIEESSIEESIIAEPLRSPQEKPPEKIKKQTEGPQDIVRILELFSVLNPAVKTMYGNKTQRKACSDLLARYELEEVEKMITEILPVTNKKEYYPIINTPYELNMKFQTLLDRLHQDKAKNKPKEENVIINGVIMKKPI